MTKGYHYTECGLDYVYLANGYTIHDTPYGEAIAIRDAVHLHEAIARDMITSSRPLRGQEVRFLRSLLDISQADLASILKVTRPTIARWEARRDESIPGTADQFLRLFYALDVMGHKATKRLLDILTEQDEHKYGNAVFRETESGWQPERVA